MIHAVLEFFERERAIVERRRHAEAVIDEGLLARTVAVVHAAKLRNGLVRFVDEEQIVRGNVIEQRGRRFTGQAAGHVARIVFDAVAVADGAHHFDIEERALHDALRLDDFSLAPELALPPFELFVDGLDGALFLRGGQHVVRLRIDGHARDFALARADFAGERIDLANGFDLAAPQFDADGEIVVGRIDFDRVAANAEGAAAEVFGAVVLNFDELAQNRLRARWTGPFRA